MPIRWNLPERAVIARQWTFALHDVDFDRCLVISRGRKCLRLARGNGRVARNRAWSSRRRTFRHPAKAASRPAAECPSLRRPALRLELPRRPRRLRQDSLPCAVLCRRTSSFTISTTRGMRVEPPTSTTSSILSAVMPASLNACFTGPTVRCRISSINWSSFVRVSFLVKCFGPEAFAVREWKIDLRFHQLRKLDLGLLSRFA